MRLRRQVLLVVALGALCCADPAVAWAQGSGAAGPRRSAQRGGATLNGLCVAAALGVAGLWWSAPLVQPTLEGLVAPLVEPIRIASPLPGVCDPPVSSDYFAVRRDEKKSAKSLVPRPRLHGALDVRAPRGTEVTAGAFAAPPLWWPFRAGEALPVGRVVSAGWGTGYEQTVVISYAPAKGEPVLVRYAHLASFARGIKPGAEVPHGAVIGRIGSKGHVHVELSGNPAGAPTRYRPLLAPCTWVRPAARR